MLSKLHHSIADKDLSSESAQVIVNNLKQIIEDVEGQFRERDSEWEQDILSVLRFFVRVEEGTYTAKLRVLGIFIRHWDDLSLNFRLAYNNQVSEFCYREAKLQLETVQNYLRGITVFDQVKPFGKVAVVQRDKFGRPMMDAAKNPVMVYKDFSVDEIQPSKLALMASVANRGEMSEKRWGMLADPCVTVADLQAEIYRVEKPSDPDPSLRFSLEGNIIVAHEFGQAVELAEIFPEMWDEELGRKGIKRILQCLGIRSDEEVIQRMERRQEVIRIYKKEQTNGNSSEGI